MSSPEMDWRDAEKRFGPDAIEVIDEAVRGTLARYKSQPIVIGEHYLVTEELTFSILVALHEKDLRLTSVVRQLEVIDCPVCGARVALTKGGMVRKHRRESEAGTCPTSGLPRPMTGGGVAEG